MSKIWYFHPYISLFGDDFEFTWVETTDEVRFRVATSNFGLLQAPGDTCESSEMADMSVNLEEQVQVL